MPIRETGGLIARLVPFLIFILFLAVGCGRKGDPIAPEDVPLKERSQPPTNEPIVPNPEQGVIEGD
jgi:hypothetical protein